MVGAGPMREATRWRSSSGSYLAAVHFCTTQTLAQPMSSLCVGALVPKWSPLEAHPCRRTELGCGTLPRSRGAAWCRVLRASLNPLFACFASSNLFFLRRKCVKLYERARVRNLHSAQPFNHPRQHSNDHALQHLPPTRPQHPHLPRRAHAGRCLCRQEPSSHEPAAPATPDHGPRRTGPSTRRGAQHMGSRPSARRGRRSCTGPPQRGRGG